MSSTRSYALVVVAGVAAGGLGFLSAGRPWSRVTISSAGMPADRVLVTGTDALPLVSAMALVVLAGSVAVLASSPRVRVVVGLVIICAALTAVVDIVAGTGAVHDAVLERVRSSTSMTGGVRAQEAVAAAAAATAWRWIALLAMVVAALAGSAVVLLGRTWPTMGRRYDAPATATSVRDDDPWKALDRGEDPTV